VLNALLGGTSALLAEALTLGRKGGLDTSQMMDVLLESAVGSPLTRYKRDMLVEGDYTAQFSVAQMMKDLDLILACGREAHVPLFIASLARQAFEAAFAQGDGGEDFFVLYRRHQQLAGL
jgi:3-hydroxyisobutyrate dehydrogenase-like beta-hydroxyacid dehydrogenase